jgi:hypothetical protein
MRLLPAFVVSALVPSMAGAEPEPHNLGPLLREAFGGAASRCDVDGCETHVHAVWCERGKRPATCHAIDESGTALTETGEAASQLARQLAAMNRVGRVAAWRLDCHDRGGAATEQPHYSCSVELHYGDVKLHQALWITHLIGNSKLGGISWTGDVRLSCPDHAGCRARCARPPASDEPVSDDDVWSRCRIPAGKEGLEAMDASLADMVRLRAGGSEAIVHCSTSGMGDFGLITSTSCEVTSP